MADQIKPEPAPFSTPLEELTEHGLLYRLLIGMNNLVELELEPNESIAKLPGQVREFWINEDHGLGHSRKIRERISRILMPCYHMLRLSHFQGISPTDMHCLLDWAAVLHDFGRFTDHKSIEEHQQFGAELAMYCFLDDAEVGDALTTALHDIIVHHDYICEFVDMAQLPKEFIRNPLAEMFRLADCTSLTPPDELERYYATGKRLGGIFFDPNLTDDERFDFSGNKAKWDFLNYFLLLFAIQPKDWFYGETRDLYREWQDRAGGGKNRAAARIIELAKAESYDDQQILQLIGVMDRFFRRFCLPNYVG